MAAEMQKALHVLTCLCAASNIAHAQGSAVDELRRKPLAELRQIELSIEDLSDDAQACGINRQLINDAFMYPASSASFSIVGDGNSTIFYIHIATLRSLANLCTSSVDVRQTGPALPGCLQNCYSQPQVHPENPGLKLGGDKMKVASHSGRQQIGGIIGLLLFGLLVTPPAAFADNLTPLVEPTGGAKGLGLSPVQVAKAPGGTEFYAITNGENDDCGSLFSLAQTSKGTWAPHLVIKFQTS